MLIRRLGVGESDEVKKASGAKRSLWVSEAKNASTKQNPLPRRDHHRDLYIETLVTLS